MILEALSAKRGAFSEAPSQLHPQLLGPTTRQRCLRAYCKSRVPEGWKQSRGSQCRLLSQAMVTAGLSTCPTKYSGQRGGWGALSSAAQAGTLERKGGAIINYPGTT